jgi:hypothetical protein
MGTDSWPAHEYASLFDVCHCVAFAALECSLEKQWFHGSRSDNDSINAQQSSDVFRPDQAEGMFLGEFPTSDAEFLYGFRVLWILDL